MTGLSAPSAPSAPPTADRAYSERLQRLSGARWKRWLGVQLPYRWNLRRLRLGRVLDVGCGIGRNLAHLPGGVGVDHNADSVRVARSRGLEAYTTEEFFGAAGAALGPFDSILAAHLVEHMPEDEGRRVLAGYLPFLRPGGRLVVITPQERGFRSDPTHVWFARSGDVARMARDLGLDVERQFSFPFPRALGRVFTHNESVTVCRRPGP